MPGATYDFNEREIPDDFLNYSMFYPLAAFDASAAMLDPLFHDPSTHYEPFSLPSLQERVSHATSRQIGTDLTPFPQAGQHMVLDGPYDFHDLYSLPEKPEAEVVQRSYAKAPRRCNFCKKEFRRPGALNDHLNTHTGERPHICPYCPASFAAKSNLSRHKKTQHSD
ncbi:hypothetical protein BDV93DRAFT_560883 [Ceratobasidium sp. AG-I]|nr:hypothetical protein BDV93DRAFT_560883 [Ceratobasidium sp. AG-I]